MPLPASVEEVVSIELPDEDYLCSLNDCTRAAVWWDDCRTCGHPAYRCEPCRKVTDDMVDQFGMFDLVCKPCGGRMPRPIPWKALRA